MGQNRRYGSDLTDATVNEVLIRPRPIGLSDAEVGPVDASAEREPLPVRAWVRFPEHAICVEGRAVSWNDRAVQVEFTLRSGATHRCWVWASAVEGSRRQPE